MLAYRQCLSRRIRGIVLLRLRRTRNLVLLLLARTSPAIQLIVLLMKMKVVRKTRQILQRYHNLPQNLSVVI